ncbi:MAG TPA: hypothetical protein VGK96_09415, partial [Candidatus Sulfotelmatobacter sp.]
FPLFLIGSTGWIPGGYLDLPPKGAWPWGAIIGLLLITVGVVGILLPEGRVRNHCHEVSNQ